MAEIINTYSFDHQEQLIPMDRDDFYAEQIALAESGKLTNKYVEVVNVFLFTEHGELIVQKRSREKKHNANLLDKSMGGHVRCGDTPSLTAMIETVQELQTPSMVLNNKIDFLKTYRTLETYLTTTAILEYVGTYDVVIPKIINGKSIGIGNRTHLFFGVYGGKVKNIDREAKGILYYTLDDLLQEMKEFPETFTHDMHHYISRNLADMREFLATIGK
ncbi:NUDIX domain-containing protein [Candidatus Gracilibacteria bacterium]|jgi:isopentenyldiphosphate isomerase|nr:NUDIX domain-containing protein [Candidatus Gracilibacteria bacterium]